MDGRHRVGGTEPGVSASSFAQFAFRRCPVTLIGCTADVLDRLFAGESKIIDHRAQIGLGRLPSACFPRTKATINVGSPSAVSAEHSTFLQVLVGAGDCSGRDAQIPG